MKSVLSTELARSFIARMLALPNQCLMRTPFNPIARNLVRSLSRIIRMLYLRLSSLLQLLLYRLRRERRLRLLDSSYTRRCQLMFGQRRIELYSRPKTIITMIELRLVTIARQKITSTNTKTITLNCYLVAKLIAPLPTKRIQILYTLLRRLL